MESLTRRTALGWGVAAAAFAALPARRASAGEEATSGPGTTPAATIPTRGFNLPGWVDRPDGSRPAPDVLDRLHHLGFRSVRLPIDPGMLGGTNRTGPDSPLDRALDRIGEAASELVHRGFAVSLDMHPGGALLDQLRDDPGTAGATIERAWANVAMVMLALPERRVHAELLNEPPLERASWIALRDRLARTIRQSCPRHGLIWGPSRFQGIWELAGTPPLADDNAVAAVHYYAPMAFTHQCENWDGSPLGRLGHLPFPATANTPAVRDLKAKLENEGDQAALTMLNDAFETPWSVEAINRDFDDAARWARENRQPVILNEFGVLDFCVDPKSRQAWTAAVRAAAEHHGIGWSYWEFDHGFGFVGDRSRADSFDHAMIEALIPEAAG